MVFSDEQRTFIDKESGYMRAKDQRFGFLCTLEYGLCLNFGKVDIFLLT